MPTIHPLELTYYEYTGYNPNDEPASDAVIDTNPHWTSPLYLKEYDPITLTNIRVQVTDDELKLVDYLKIRDTITNERFYYYILNHVRANERVAVISIALDAFATVGLANLSFFGNITRRSLSAAERDDYPLLPEPWAPRRPLKVRRLVIDLNQNKTIRIPSHISTTFEEDITEIDKTETIQVPNSPVSLTTTPDNLTVNALLPMGYPNAADDTTHSIVTPWGDITYTTPYETYYTLSGNALKIFLEKAKKFNALDLLEAPYYLPSPEGSQTITISEFNKPNLRNKKAYKYYTTLTIRALASNSSQSYSDQNADLQPNQTLNIIIVPDKNGGIYVLPSTIRDTGLNAYTYLDGVYSPFETVMMNAIGDTPAKFAADGTNILNEALNNLFQTYINKINALQYEGMQAKYFKDLGAVKGVVMSFIAEALGSTSITTTTTDGYWQNSTTLTNTPTVMQRSSQTQISSGYTQSQSQNTYIPGTTQNSTTRIPTTKGSQTSNTFEPTRTQNTGSYTQRTSGYSYTQPSSNGGTVSIPAVNTTVSSVMTTTYGGWVNTTTSTSQDGYNQTTTTTSPSYWQNTSGTVTVPSVNTTSSGTVTTNGYTQNATQNTWVQPQTTNSTTTVIGTTRDVEKGVNIAEGGISHVYDNVDNWDVLRTMIFGGYRNEVHSFMLGNINDYLNRWTSIQNDIHNGKTANLFKNITLVGSYNDYNKLAGKYEIIVTSLQPEDETNFDLFLDHFGYAVDEYSEQLVTDAGGSYNYVMVGDDALLYNAKYASLNSLILSQFRAGVRVWKTQIRPENY